MIENKKLKCNEPILVELDVEDIQYLIRTLIYNIDMIDNPKTFKRVEELIQHFTALIDITP